jgi:tetratricopeptide (TPR) repeat protein
MVETLDRGRDALDRHAWAEAMDVFAEADRSGGLDAEDLERLGTAAWWAGRPDEATEAQERAFASYEDAGRPTDAARMAMALAYQAFRREAPSVGAGWQARAERLLQAVPESSAHARLLVYQAVGALFGNQITQAIALTDRAMEVAERHRDPNARFSAMSFKGIALVASGNWPAGFALIDEAATAASSGQLDLRVASDIYCNTIAACRNAGDLQRAAQWADEGERWMHKQSLGGYPGICRVHRAELKMLRGLWSEAEQEARQACDELGRFGLVDGVAWAHYTIGEIRLRMGDLQRSPAWRCCTWLTGTLRKRVDRSSAPSWWRPATAVIGTEPSGRACSRRRSTSRSPPAIWRRPAAP